MLRTDRYSVGSYNIFSGHDMGVLAENQPAGRENPWDIAVASFMKCKRGDGNFSASGNGAYANGKWARDFGTAGDALLEIGGAENIGLVENICGYFLDKSPDIPYRSMEYNHMLFQIGIRLRSQSDETMIPLTKRIFNRSALRGEHPYVADTFVILKLAAHFCTSENVPEKQRQQFWYRHAVHMHHYMQEFTKPGSPFISSDSLVQESPLASRADCLYKSGNVLLTNVNWYLTLRDLGKAARERGHQEWGDELAAMAETVHRAVNIKLWDEERGHYHDWIDRQGRKHDYFDSLGHSWAVVSGIADSRKTLKILEFIQTNNLYHPEHRLLATVDRPYDTGLFEWILRAADGTAWFNSGDKGVFWPEMTVMYAAALKKAGFEGMAVQVLHSVEELLEEHQTLHETYGADRKPISVMRRVLKILDIPYNSAEAFAMALGLYIWVKNNWEKFSEM